ncbi:MAG: phage virion morphogenesis protein [Candidatus Gastranaerophilales bacterium]|nr:phage virion morphogenesis protein [Candidatus Gastranaerophilales bacterium]
MPDKFFTSSFNADESVKFLNNLQKKFKDLSPLMKTARVFLKKTVNKNFETQGEHTDEKWMPWSENYKKWRMKNGKSLKLILTLDGELRRSIMAKSGKDYALVGTNKEYAAIHNFGYKGKVNKKSKKGKLFTAKMNMPKREFMRLDDKTKEELLAELYIKSEEMIIEVR